MRRSSNWRIRLFTLFSLTQFSLLLCSPGVSGEEFIMDKVYFDIGLAQIFNADARFSDAGNADSDLSPLYGSSKRFTDGKFSGTQWQFGVGYRFSSRLRAQLELGMINNLAFKGNANYARSGERQPSTAKLDTRQLLLSGFYDFSPWNAGSDLQIQPYLGVGMGFSNYKLKDFVQQFPEPDNPKGYLRRGPNGEIPLTRLPAGTGQEFAYMLTSGVVIPVTKRVRLDLSYRYTDAGRNKN